MNLVESRKENHQDFGILVYDEEDRSACRRLSDLIRKYCSETQAGYKLSQYLLPAPFFVYSEQTPLVQAADLVIYILNWSTRVGRRMKQPIRKEMCSLGSKVGKLQKKLFKEGDFTSKPFYSIFYVDTLVDPRDQEQYEEYLDRIKKEKKKKRRGAKSSSHPHKRKQLSLSTPKLTEIQLTLDL